MIWEGETMIKRSCCVFLVITLMCGLLGFGWAEDAVTPTVLGGAVKVITNAQGRMGKPGYAAYIAAWRVQ